MRTSLPALLTARTVFQSCEYHMSGRGSDPRHFAGLHPFVPRAGSSRCVLRRCGGGFARLCVRNFTSSTQDALVFSEDVRASKCSFLVCKGGRLFHSFEFKLRQPASVVVMDVTHKRI